MLFSSWLRNCKCCLERRWALHQSRRWRAPARRRAPRLLLELLEDRTLLSTYVVTNTGDYYSDPSPGAGTGTLRQAIVDANAAHTDTQSSPDRIVFKIPSTDPGYNSITGVCTIQPETDLPTITDTLVLDGYTQPGASVNTSGG